MNSWTRRKPIAPAGERHLDALPPTLSWPHLMMLGAGAERAELAVLLSFAIAGAVSFAA